MSRMQNPKHANSTEVTDWMLNFKSISTLQSPNCASYLTFGQQDNLMLFTIPWTQSRCTSLHLWHRQEQHRAYKMHPAR
jgi:hypothetical protein